jgi:TPR repeat protein
MSLQRFPLCAFIFSAVFVLTPLAQAQVASSQKPALRDSSIQADELYAAGDYATALQIYRKAAAAGQTHAMTQVGLCYDLGHGVKNDDAEAMRWYRKAADAGDLDAMAYIGGLYANGFGGPANYPEALSWFHKSADAGGAAGMNKLGLAYQNGRGVPKDPQLALQWYLKAANLGDMYAMNNLGGMYIGRSGIPANTQESLRWYKKAAELGETDSMNSLATIYDIGWGSIPKNSKEAEYWFAKSASLGSENGRQALMRIGGWQNFDFNGDWEAYFTTPALPEAIRIVQHNDTLQAVRLRSNLSPIGLSFLRAKYNRGQQQGMVELAGISLLNLIQALSTGTSSNVPGIQDSWSVATITVLDPDHFSVNGKPPFQRITTPRPNDIPCSPQNPLRVKPQWAYIRGKMAVDAKKYEAAACWFHIGVDAGFARSRSGMGDLTRNGWGTSKNSSWAFTWYERAAQQGDPYAAASIADMYDKGELPVDTAKSRLWHDRALTLKEASDKGLAVAKKKAEDDQAALHLIGAIALVGGQLLTWDVGADPECDTRRRDRTGSPILGSVDPGRESARDAGVANGTMYCGRPIDISPLFPENWK